MSVFRLRGLQTDSPHLRPPGRLHKKRRARPLQSPRWRKEKSHENDLQNASKYASRMQAIGNQALTVNLVFGTLVFVAAARLYVIPRMNEWRPDAVLVPILLLHAQRHLGLMLLAGGAVYPGMPPQFAWPAAMGDLIAAALAFLAIPATLRDFRSATFLLWVFNIVGTLDLVAAILLANIFHAPLHMGAAYGIPAFWVP